MRYRSVARKLFKRRLGVSTRHVQDHHVIPKQWKQHPAVVRANFDVNCSHNLLMMPTSHGHRELDVRHTRYIHDGGHHYYNLYVKQMLDSINGIQCERDFILEFVYFQVFLRQTLRHGDDTIPWN